MAKRARRRPDADESTISTPTFERDYAPSAVALTILYHPDPDRAGERAVLVGLHDNRPISLSRSEPAFALGAHAEPRGLADVHLSRKPFELVGAADGSITLRRNGVGTDMMVDDRPLQQGATLSREAIERGVILFMGQRVVLLLHLAGLPVEAPESFGLVGDGRAMTSLRREMQRVIDVDVPVLLLGETGTGKDLVARAIHGAGPRREKPFIGVNMGGIPPTLAASELFGATKGAFTGATQSRDGYFRRANGGTLFLDEIGELPEDVQPFLLRALESGESQPVGAERPVLVDVRVIAATDRDLDEAVRDGRFRAALLHRLNGYPIEVAPLRERLEDFGLLLNHFLREQLESTSGVDRLAHRDDAEPWLAAELVALLARHDWPGNVRELRNVSRQIVIYSGTAEAAALPPSLEKTFTARKQTRREAEAHTPQRGRAPSDVTEDKLIAALEKHAWRLKAAAAELGIARASLYDLIEASPRLRKASEIPREEIEACLERARGDVAIAARELKVSRPALKRRMTALGF